MSRAVLQSVRLPRTKAQLCSAAGWGLLLLLRCFSCVWLCATPWTAAHQVPSSLGFSRQEHWSGLSFPSPMHESESEVAQSCLTLSNPMDCSLPGSSACGIFQARVLEWGAIALSGQGLVHVIPRAPHTSLFSSPLSGSYCSSPCFTTRKLRFRVL